MSTRKTLQTAVKPYPRYGQMVKGYKYAAPITFNEYGHLSSGYFPADCIADCSASGAVDESVEYWVTKLSFDFDSALGVRYLKEFGAWSADELQDHEQNRRRVLWTACCDIKEQGEWLGLCH